MAVSARIGFILRALESQSKDFGLATLPALIEYPTAAVNSGSAEFATGTGDYQFDRVWSDERTLVATSENLDLSGSLFSQLDGSAVSFVEIGGIVIYNTATVAASRLLVGGVASGAFSGLFGDVSDVIKVGALGVFIWIAPLDGGGVTVTNTSADLLKIDSGAATITYRILILGRSA